MGLSPASKVSTSNVALLIAVPLTEDDFRSSVGKSDWLAKYNDQNLDASARSDVLQRHWSDEYLPFVAAPLQELTNLAKNLDVEVRTRAQLLDLKECSVKKAVLILFAHWKGPEVLAEDFVEPIDASELLKRARKSDAILARWIAETLCSETGLVQQKSPIAKILRMIKGRGKRSVRHVLTDALSAPLSEEIPDHGVQKLLERPITRMTRRREMINELFYGLIRPGNRLELFDGLHSKEDVECSIDESFDGILDLTVCTSTVLADYISAKRRQRLRTVQFPTVQDLLWGATCISETLKLVASGYAYLEARLTASQVVGSAIREIASARRDVPFDANLGKSQ
jgi:hypothetical protein